MLEDFVGQQVRNVSDLGDGWFEIDFYSKVFVTNRPFSTDYYTGIFRLHDEENKMNIPEDRLTYLATKADIFGVVFVCEPVFNNPKFVLWSGSSKPFQHHYGKGGLVIHTAEVVNRTLGSPLEEQRVFLAGLFHDVGKMWDYEPCGVSQDKDHQYDEWRGTEHKRTIHHITRSAIEWTKALVKTGTWADEFQDDIMHAILAHHGSRQAGSPVFPKTKLAWLLHLCDGISARMDDADKNDYLGEVRK